MLEAKISIRVGVKQDLHFIYDSFAKSMAKTEYNKYIVDFLPKIIKKIPILCERSMILVSSLEKDRNEIISYIVYTSFDNKLVIHYCYTKADARQQGICRELIDTANINNDFIIFTHPAVNPNAMKHFSKKYIYDPSLLELL